MGSGWPCCVPHAGGFRLWARKARCEAPRGAPGVGSKTRAVWEVVIYYQASRNLPQVTTCDLRLGLHVSPTNKNRRPVVESGVLVVPGRMPFCWVGFVRFMVEGGWAHGCGTLANVNSAG